MPTTNRLAVNGTLMRGLALSDNLLNVGAVFAGEHATAPCYRLWSINDEHPAMIRTSDCSGASIALEIWEVPLVGITTVLTQEPIGLAIGKVLLRDNTTVLGVLGEPFIVEGQREITSFGGWRNYTASHS